MMRIPFTLPDGWPWSTWFFIITLIVYLLQRFPLTGVFLMIVGAAFWSILLINAGMLGIVVEAVMGRSSPLWLALPALYFGLYYAAYANDQAMLAHVRAETARFNQGKTLPFDGKSRDLLVEARGDDGTGVTPSELVERYDVPRAFDHDKMVFTTGTPEVCALVNSDHAFMSAGIQASMITVRTDGWRSKSTGYCRVAMPGRPDKPVVRLLGAKATERQRLLELNVTEFTASDSVTGASATVRSGIAHALKRIPMPIMGCALNSGAPSWDCFHGFLRDREQLVAGLGKYSGGSEVVARLLGLTRTDDHQASAIGPEPFQAIADRIAGEVTAKEVAVLEQMLATPTEYIKNGWLYHLPDRPEIVAPYAPRIFGALETLQASELRDSDTGRNLWRLVTVMPEQTVAPYRPRMAALMQLPGVREWTFSSFGAYKQLDTSDPVQRGIVLDRIAANPRQFVGELLPPFCRMGAAAPAEVKQALLGLWRARAPGANSPNSRHRDSQDTLLYLTLARMGLKAEAGQVEQRYHGPDFRMIWNHVTPDSPDDICVGTSHELRVYFRKMGLRS